MLKYLVLKRQNGGLNGGLADKIIVAISSDKTITVSEISDILNIPKRTVEREIKNLRESGRIIRKGGRRYGYWEIMQLFKNMKYRFANHHFWSEGYWV